MRHSALTLDLRSGSADWHSLRGCQRFLLTALIVCLPVPALAASGMAIPLPPIVYRVAVGLAERTQAIAVHVPGFEAVVSDRIETPRRGVIRLSAQELAASSETGATALEELGDGAASSDRPLRTIAVAAGASTPRQAPRTARAGSAGVSVATQEPQLTAAVVSAEAEVPVPAAVPPQHSSEEGSPPAPTPPAEVEQARPSPPASSEPQAAPSDPAPSEAKSVPTSEPTPVLSDTLTPVDGVETPTSDPAPSDPVETSKSGSPSESPQVRSNSSLGALQPPVESVLPGERSSPRILGRLE